MSKADYYEVLGVTKTVTKVELKRAYRRKAMKYHPDRNSGDDAKIAEKKFKECKEAYEVLKDEKKRAAYDQFGHAGVDHSVGGQGRQGGAGGFEDIFNDFFGGGGGGRGRQRQQRGADLQYNLNITLEQAVAGFKEKIEIPTQVKCESCNGSGAKKGTEPKKCETCGGVGQVVMKQGFFSVQQTCPHCHGQGAIISDPCNTCHGSGRVKDSKTLSVDIPAGVDTGDRIRLSGEGEAAPQGGINGDLYVDIRVKEHEFFTRDNAHLFCQIHIAFTKACLGGEVEVPTLTGKVNLKIPAGTQSGKQFRISGKGVKPVRGGMIGDLICEVQIETPVNLTDEQKELLIKLDGLLDGGGDKHNPHSSSWLDGVKGFFEKMGL